MKKKTLYLCITAILFIATVIFAVLDVDAVFPSTLVGFFLMLTLIASDDEKKNTSGKAGKTAVIVFSILIILMNFFITILLPVISSSTDLSGVSVELTTNINANSNAEVADHFVEVTINDIHEFCYGTCILLIINCISIAGYRIKGRRKNELIPG